MAVNKTVKLNSGYEMPVLGLGTWTVWQNPEGQMAEVIREAIKVGFRHIDTAKVYETEPLMGPVLADLIKSGAVTREELFLTCKVWCTDHRPDDVRSTVDQSLKDLQTNYIDLFLIHWPMAYKPGKELFPKDESGSFIFDDVDFIDTWKTLEELVDQGKIRSIGLSNFNIDQIKRVLESARIKPSNLQIELNPYFTNKALADFCAEKGIVVSVYAPFGNPGRTWDKELPSVLQDEVVKRIAVKYNKTPAQVLIRWPIQKGYVALPKTVTVSRLAENFNVFDFSLDEEDMAALDGLNRDLRIYKESSAKDSPYYPF